MLSWRKACSAWIASVVLLLDQYRILKAGSSCMFVSKEASFEPPACITWIEDVHHTGPALSVWLLQRSLMLDLTGDLQQFMSISVCQRYVLEFAFYAWRSWDILVNLLGIHRNSTYVYPVLFILRPWRRGCETQGITMYNRHAHMLHDQNQSLAYLLAKPMHRCSVPLDI